MQVAHIKSKMYYFMFTEAILRASIHVSSSKFVIRYLYNNRYTVTLVFSSKSLILKVYDKNELQQRRTIAYGNAISERLAPAILETCMTKKFRPVEYVTDDFLDFDLKEISDLASSYPDLISYLCTKDYHSVAIQPILVLSENFHVVVPSQLSTSKVLPNKETKV